MFAFVMFLSLVLTFPKSPPNHFVYFTDLIEINTYLCIDERRHKTEVLCWSYAEEINRYVIVLTEYDCSPLPKISTAGNCWVVKVGGKHIHAKYLHVIRTKESRIQ